MRQNDGGPGSGPRPAGESPTTGRVGGDATPAAPAPGTATAPRPSSSSRPSGAVVRMTPAAALGRHMEWLEFALAAARSEETWRVGRLEKATKKNREKRTIRLAEVRAEIAELSLLIEAIRGLQARGTRTPAATPSRSRGAGPRKTRARATEIAAAGEVATAAEVASASPPATRARRRPGGPPPDASA